MKQRTFSSLVAALLVSLPTAAALAQPAPDGPKPDNPPADKPAGDKPPSDAAPDKAQADKAAADKAAADKAPVKPLEEGAGEKGENGTTKPTPNEEWTNVRRPFVLSSHDFVAWPIALIQAQATPYVGKDASFLAGDIAERPGFRLRRARFGIGGSYKELLELELSGELTTDREATLAIHEAWVGVTPKPYFGAAMGILPVPFSRSALIATADTALIDRPLAVRAMAPFHQLGALVGGSIADRFHYSLGVFNGFERGDQFYTGYEESLAALGNRFDNLAYAGRVSASLLAPGADVPRYGDTKTRLNVGAAYFFSDGGARDIHSVEGDVYFHSNGIRALAEVLYSTTVPESQPTQPTTQNANINALGAVVEGGYTYHNLVGGHLRFEWIDPNMAVQDASDNWLLTVGVSFMPPVVGDFMRAQVEFTHREEVHGQSLENDALTLQTQFVLQ